jgi:hypothetical protein
MKQSAGETERIRLKRVRYSAEAFLLSVQPILGWENQNITESQIENRQRSEVRRGVEKLKDILIKSDRNGSYTKTIFHRYGRHEAVISKLVQGEGEEETMNPLQRLRFI